MTQRISDRDILTLVSIEWTNHKCKTVQKTEGLKMKMIEKTVVVLLCCASWSFACGKGCSEYQGVCACDIAPEKAPDVDSSKWTSDEKPPRDKMPSYEREGITTADIKPQMTVDDEIAAAKAEEQRTKNAGNIVAVDATQNHDPADIEGKKAAGL
jgi:hypothetical protein